VRVALTFIIGGVAIYVFVLDILYLK